MSHLDLINHFKKWVVCFCIVLAFPSLQADICDECDPCQSDWISDWGISRGALLLGGGAVLGGIAGAVTGYSYSRHNHSSHHHSSYSCSSGPFLIDHSSGHVIVFQMAVEPTTFTSTDSVNIRPFVETPDGRVHEGELANFSGTSANQLTHFPGINIENPLIGTYHFGLKLSDATLDSTASIQASPSVVTSRKGAVTNLEMISIDSSSFTIENGLNLQVTWAFTYAEADLP